MTADRGFRLLILDCGLRIVGAERIGHGAKAFDCGFWIADCGLLEQSAEGMAHWVKD